MSRTEAKPEPKADGGAGRSIAHTVRDHMRAIVGGLLVGLPLLWTQEMWDRGSTLPPLKLLLLLAVAFGIVVGFNAVSGFRRERSLLELLLDSLQGLGLSVLIAAAALVILGRLEPEHGIGPMVGRIVLESIPVAFGTALATTALSESEDSGGREAVGPIGHLFVAAGGALYFALNIAPTDEVRVLGSESATPLLLIAMMASLTMGLATLLVLKRPTGPRSWIGNGPLDGPIGETIAAYAVALLISFLLLWSFDIVQGLGFRALVGHVVMLSIVAAFGAGAGRLLVGDGSDVDGSDANASDAAVPVGA